MSRILRHGIVTIASLWYGLTFALELSSGHIVALCCIMLALLSGWACLDHAKALWWLLRNRR